MMNEADHNGIYLTFSNFLFYTDKYGIYARVVE